MIAFDIQCFYTTKNIPEADHIIHLCFTLKTKEIQGLIDKYIEDAFQYTVVGKGIID